MPASSQLKRIIAASGFVIVTIATQQLQAATVASGGTVYTNPFATGLTTLDNFQGGGNGPVTNGVDGQAGQGNYSAASKTMNGTTDTGPGGSTPYFQYQVPSNFTVGTIVSVQYGQGAGVFSNTPSDPYSVRVGQASAGTVLSSGGTATPSTGGMPGSSPYTVSTLSTPVSANTMRVEFGGLGHVGGNSYGEVTEVAALPDQLARINVASATANFAAAAGSPGGAVDLQKESYWVGPAKSGTGIGNNPDTLTLNFSSASNVSAILFNNFEGGTGNSAGEQFDVLASTGGAYTKIVSDVTLAGGDFSTIKLDSVAMGVTSLQFDFSQYAQTPNFAAFLEVIPFTDASTPEPASLSLVGFAAVGLLARRRNRKV